MKKLLSLTLLLLLCVTTNMFAQGMAHDKKAKASPHEAASGDNIKISYGRPYKKGRAIFGDLVPYGKVWRAGADEATEITVAKDCLFGGKKLKAGTYTLFVTPEQKEWTIILNSELKQWGSFGYDKIKDKDVLHIEVPVKHMDKVVEQFTITLPAGGIKMEWDQTGVFIPVKFM